MKRVVVAAPPAAFWKLYGVNLPDTVLRKLYYANALKVTPGLATQAFPDRSHP